jgi:hypothetical protein
MIEARSASRPTSPKQASSQGQARCAIAEQSSGPMPAGSPEVIAIRARGFRA